MENQFLTPARAGLAFVLVILGCSSDDGPTKPQAQNLSGRWQLVSGGNGVATDFWSGGSTGFSVVLELEQSGNSISGRSHSGRSSGSVIGWDYSQPVEVAIPADEVSGSVNGDQVELSVRTGSRESSRRTFRGSVTDNGLAGSDWSASRGGEFVPEPPAAPSNLAVVGWVPQGAISFRWDDNSSDEDVFLLFERRDLGDPRLIATADPDTEEGTWQGRCLGDVFCEYWIHAYVISENSLSPASNKVSVERDDYVNPFPG